MFPAFSVLGKTIGTYPLCTLIGLFICVFIAYRFSKNKSMTFEDLILLALVCMGSILVGGHAMYGLTQLKTLFTNFNKIGSIKQAFSLLAYCFGGSVFYGGFIGLYIAVNIYVKPKRFNDTVFIKDLVATFVPLFHCFGRIGCFLGGCCYGIESKFGFITKSNTFNPSINGVVRFPVALLEAGCNLILFAFLVMIFKKNKTNGKQFYYYMILYSPIRFLDEFLRGDLIRGHFLLLSTSQWISIILFVFGISMIIIKSAKLKKEPQD